MKSGDLIFIPQSIYVARDYQGVPAILKKKFITKSGDGRSFRNGWECVMMGYAGTSTPGTIVRFYDYQLGFEK
jgi:hypothetical protein